MTPESPGAAVMQALRNRILVVTAANPPVHALAANVRRELRAAIEACGKPVLAGTCAFAQHDPVFG